MHCLSWECGLSLRAGGRGQWREGLLKLVLEQENRLSRRTCKPSLNPSSLLLFIAAAAAAKSFQSCPTLCNPIDSSPPGSAIPGILQARTLEWVAISFSNA